MSQGQIIGKKTPNISERNKELIIQEFRNRRANILSMVVVEISLFPEGFKEFVHKALLFKSMAALECGLSVWSGMIEWNRPFMYPEAELMIQILNNALPSEMGQTLQENLEMIRTQCRELNTKLKEIEEKSLESLIRELNAKAISHGGLPIGKEITIGTA